MIDRAALAHSWIAREIVAGRPHTGYADLAVFLSVHTGHPHTVGMVARILDNEAKRDSAERRAWKAQPPDAEHPGA
jgi:hypothetical protein